MGNYCISLAGGYLVIPCIGENVLGLLIEAKFIGFVCDWRMSSLDFISVDDHDVEM